MAGRNAPPTMSTKLLVPEVRRGSIRRERLVRALDDGARRPLTVVCAPAGYGKTTALVQWLETGDVDYAWLLLDPYDNDPNWLAARLLAALDGAMPGQLVDAERAVRAGSDLGATVVPLVVNALAARRDRLMVVLDDYQVLVDSDSHQLTRDLIDALPSTVGVVVASRTVPPLRLARRRAAGTLAEIGREELRLELDELERVLKGSFGLALKADQVDLIHRRFQGWPAGVALVGGALASRPDPATFLDAMAGSRATLEAYLIEEVLETVTPELREFMCRTSILSSLSAPSCEAVYGDPQAHELLDEVRRMNLFVTPVGPDGTSARYYEPFAETLRRELERVEPELVPHLHRRASRWFEQNGIPEDAIEHAMAAGEGDRAALLLAANWPALIADRRHATVRRILDRLPADRGALGPFCEALDVVCLIYEGVDQRITAERARAIAAEHGGNPAVRPLIDAALISPFYGQIGRVAELAREAWRRYADIPEIQTQLAGQVALVLWFAGEYEEVRRLLEPRAGLDQPAYARIWTLAILSITAAEQGDAELAEQFGRQAVAEVEASGGETAIEFAGAAWVLGEALRQRGKLEEARRYMDLGLANEGRRPGSISQANALIYDAKLALAEDDRPRARASARRARDIASRYDDLGTTMAKLDRIDAALASPSANPLLGSKPTPAELQVLRLLDSDRTFAAIADELYLSRDTVKSHARRLYRRLGERTRAGAVAAARERGLLDTE